MFQTLKDREVKSDKEKHTGGELSRLINGKSNQSTGSYIKHILLNCIRFAANLQSYKLEFAI